MARGMLIGHLDNCPTCGLEQMEVRLDKNRNPYAFCEDCNTQILTHGKRKGKLMLQRMEPVVSYRLDDGGHVEIIEDEPEPEAVEEVEEASDEPAAPVQVKEDKPRRRVGMMGG